MRENVQVSGRGVHFLVRQPECGIARERTVGLRCLHAPRIAVLGFFLLASVASAEAPSVASADALWLVESFAGRCDFDVALSQWSKVSLEERSSFDGRLLRARILIQLDRGSDALAELNALRAEADDKRLAEVLLTLGLAQSSARLFGQAEKTIRAAGEKGADLDLVEAGLAEIRLGSGKVAEAEELLRQLLRRVPAMVGPILNLATIRANQGHVAEAAALIRFAWQLGYQNPKELRKSMEYERVRTMGLINDLITTPVGRCAIY